MWTPEDVKARFLEAVDIERRIYVKGASRVGNGWPQYAFTAIERKECWDDAAWEDEAENWRNRKFTTSAEQSRWQEVVFEWRLLIPIERRDLVWDFAECRARGWSFSKYCEDRGLVRMTAYRRVDRMLEDLAALFALEHRSLKPAANHWVLQVAESSRMTMSTYRIRDVARHKLSHPPFLTEKPTDHLTTPEALAEFAKHLAEVNEQRRKARLRKALRGVPGEQEAA